MKKFIIKIIVLLMPFAIFIATINFFIDPAHIFSNGNYEKRVADILIKGNNINNLRNFDERLAVKNIISKLPYKPQVVAIGTSRLLQMSSDFFPNSKFLNCSMSHASLKDFIAVIGLLDSSQKLPSEIFLETSPTIINSSNSDEWESIREYYQYGISKMGINSNDKGENIQFDVFKKKITALFSFAYFQSSVARFSIRHQNAFKDVGKTIPQNFGRLSDFSIIYPKSYHTPDTLKAMADAKIFVSKTAIPKISSKELGVLKNVLAYLKEKNVKVTLVNIPFQPDCFNLLNQKNNLFDGLTNAIKSFAVSNNVALVGTFDPNNAGLKRSQFWDQIHCDKEGLRKVVNIILYNPYLKN
ncbi:MAG: D-alanyl-lipoteichoic acid biosynthesis protein DltD [Chitinophagaceae bacterium]